MAANDVPTPHEEAKVRGEALRRLRENTRNPKTGGKMTQADAAAAYGVKRQAWNNYEQGERLLILRPHVQEDLVRAIGRTREDLDREVAEILGEEYRPSGERRSFGAANVYELPVLGRVEASPAGPQIFDTTGEPESVVDVSWMFGPSARTMRVAGDSMTGYVESGQLVIYDLKAWPTRGDGCVVALQNGELYVKEYVETSQGVLRVKQRFPEELLSFPMSDVKGVYLVRLRGVL